MVEALFAAHFTDGHDIGDHGVLIAVARSAGWTRGGAAVPDLRR